MVLVHGLLVILSSRRFSSVEVSWWVGPCTMGESRLTNWIEISRQVSRRLGNRHGKSKDSPPQKMPNNPHRRLFSQTKGPQIIVIEKDIF